MQSRTQPSAVLNRVTAFAVTGSLLYLSGLSQGMDCLAAPVSATAKTKAVPSPKQKKNLSFTPTFAFRDKTFTSFVSDSYRQMPDAKAGSSEFYRWLDTAYTKTRRTAGPVPGVSASLSLPSALDAERTRLDEINGVSAQTKQEKQFAAWAHKTVKQAIPHFSLERGFEFYNMVHGGQRQCYSQSILIAGMLQRVGIPAGVVMVWKSLNGATSNNGHAVVVAQLSNGRHLLVDASEPMAFPRQQGLFVRQNGQYLYVTPLFAKGDAEIVGYRRKSDRSRVSVDTVQTLDLAFLKSQFYYYRGERAPGGIFDTKKTATGLSRSAKRLQAAIDLCPQNPLAVYMLGRVYQRQGNTKAAKTQFAQSYQQYSRFGYLPEGAMDAFEMIGVKKPQITQAAPKAIAVSHR
jgi:hypothetical protein